MKAWVTSEASLPRGASIKPARKSRRWRPWVTAAGIVGSLVMLPVVFVLTAYIYLLASSLIFPGVRVGGRLLQGMTMQQASAVLDRAWNQEHRILAIDFSDTTRLWEAAPAEFGLSVDVQSSAAVAYAHGRQGGLIAGITQMFDGWIHGVEIRPWVAYDPFAARHGLQAWAERVSIAPVEADLRLEDGKTVQVTGQAGKALDVEASLDMLAGDPSGVMLDFQFMLLMTNPVAPAIWDVSATAAEAEGMLGSPLAIRAYDPVTDEHFVWAPTRGEIASWLRLERTEHEMRVILDSERLAAYVAGLEASLGDERTFDVEEAVAAAKLGLEGGQADTLLIHYLPRSYVVQRGDTLISISLQVGIPYWNIQEANPGLPTYGISVGREIIIPPRDAMLPLPVVINKRIVISISQQHMWVYQDGELLRDHVVSTGMASSPTMPGIFQVHERFINAYASRWDLWMPHFLGIYRATPGLLNGIHGLPLLSNGVRLWGSVLGRPASYGCIILDLGAAERLYDWAENGVVVEIRR